LNRQSLINGDKNFKASH